ncbi:agmatine deiminase family protein [Pirellulaceae bacterium SH467]
MTTRYASESGFRWVAEWEPHEATWISWPHNEETWPGLFDLIPPVTERMIRILAEVEHVHVLGGPDESYQRATHQLADCQNVTVHPIATNDCWIRDYGPTFVVKSEGSQLGAILWRFNAWGNKYHPHDWDAAANNAVCDAWETAGSTPIARFPSQLVCEGGGLETDGEGTLLTTSSCLLSYARNPDWERSRIESELKRMLAIEKVLWIDGGALAGDDTDSHIDQLVRFVRPGVVVAAVSYSFEDSNAEKLAKQYELLKQVTDARGRSLEIIPLVTPPPRYVQGKRVPESYCNFYIANELVIVPVFGYRETDDAALRVLSELFPDRTIVPLDASNFIWGLGAFHCATQQQPRVAN